MSRSGGRPRAYSSSLRRHVLNGEPLAYACGEPSSAWRRLLALAVPSTEASTRSSSRTLSLPALVVPAYAETMRMRMLVAALGAAALAAAGTALWRAASPSAPPALPASLPADSIATPAPAQAGPLAERTVPPSASHPTAPSAPNTAADPPEQQEAVLAHAVAQMSRDWSEESDRVRDAMLREGRFREVYDSGAPPEIPKTIEEDGVEKVLFTSTSEQDPSGGRRIRLFYISRNEHPRYWALRDALDKVLEAKKALREAEAASSAEAPGTGAR